MFILKLSFPLLFLFFFSACAQGSENLPSVPDAPDSVTTDGMRIKMMTYNIHHANPPSKEEGDIDINAIAQVIKKANPDFVALQEVDVHTDRSGKDLHEAEALAALTGMHYFFFKSINVHGGEYGNAILSKYPIEEAKGYLLPMKEGLAGEQRSVATVKVNLDNKHAIIVASTHFDTKNHRDIQAEKLVELFQSENLPVIIGGDFNDVEGSVALNILDQHFRRTCIGGCPATIPVRQPTRTIDFIMFRPLNALRVESHEVIPETYASDHRPVVATLQLK